MTQADHPIEIAPAAAPAVRVVDPTIRVEMHRISIARNKHGAAFSILEHQSAATIGWLASKIGRRSTGKIEGLLPMAAVGRPRPTAWCIA